MVAQTSPEAAPGAVPSLATLLAEPTARSSRNRAWQRFKRFTPGVVGLIFVIALILVAGLAGEGVMPHPCTRDTALLVGSESHGLPDSLAGLAAEKWRIPGVGGAESLSLPQAAAIMMYECAKTIR